MGRQLSVIGQSSVMVFGHGQQLVVNRQSWSVMISRQSSVVVVVSHAVVVICRSSSVIGHLSSSVNHQSVDGDGAEGGDGDKEGVDGADEEDGDGGRGGDDGRGGGDGEDEGDNGKRRRWRMMAEARRETLTQQGLEVKSEVRRQEFRKTVAAQQAHKRRSSKHTEKGGERWAAVA